MTVCFAASSGQSIPTYVVSPQNFDEFRQSLDAKTKSWVKSNQFTGKLGQALVCPDQEGGFERALLGIGTPEDRKRARFCLATAAQKLPLATYHLANDFDLPSKDYELFGWLMLGYSFTKYKETKTPVPSLVAPDWADREKIEAMVQAETLCADLINTPTNDLGPAELEKEARELASKFGMDFKAIVGDDLLSQNFPMIHTVGRASASEPRLIELRHGTKGPKISLVGKGVCFDTGGLNLKPASSIGGMKKDMGGSANVLALTRMIMDLKYACQLQVLIPAVENSVSANAFRPQDVLISRKKLSVEINNTDAEGRLILADALAYAGERDPDLIVSMATLTGAARVAVGPDLAAFFAGSPKNAAALRVSAEKAKDPVWELPFFEPYEDLIEPAVADLDNAPSGGRAGAITAALFLRRFVPNPDRYIHFDIFSWNLTTKPGRPFGGATQGARAVFHALDDLVNP